MAHELRLHEFFGFGGKHEVTRPASGPALGKDRE